LDIFWNAEHVEQQHTLAELLKIVDEPIVDADGTEPIALTPIASLECPVGQKVLSVLTQRVFIKSSRNQISQNSIARITLKCNSKLNGYY